MSNNQEDNRQWFLRTANSTIFGPVATQAFVLWAEQGRILPGHEVSTDRKKWQLAESVPELNISWYIIDSAGNLRGPLNRAIAEKILQSDKAPVGAKLIPASEADLSRVVRPAQEAQPATNTEQRQTQPATEIPSEALQEAQQKIDSLTTEVGRLKTRLTEANQAGKEAAAIEKERDALALALSETAEKLTAAEESLAVTKTNAEQTAKDSTTLLHRATMAEAKLATITQELQNIRREAQESQQAYSELLTYSNSREGELQEKIAELSKPPTPEERAAEACAVDPGGLLAAIFTQEVTLLENDLALERDTIAKIREISNKRQQVFQDRILELKRVISGGVEGGATRLRLPDATRLQAELDTLRATHTEAMRTAEERTTELSGKIRSLENETLRLRSQATETDSLHRTNREQTEIIRRHEQELEQERKQHELERENFTATQQALLRRIEQLERGLDDKELKLDYAANKQTDRDINSQNRRANLGPWFSLKK